MSRANSDHVSSKDIVRVQVPGSKSVTQRALVAAALAPGRSRIHGALRCDDSAHLTDGLQQMGVDIDWSDEALLVTGTNQLHAPSDPLFLGNAGTAVRFSTALALLADGPVTIDGVEAMRHRPMPGLLDALSQMGAQVTTLRRPGRPPVRIEPPQDRALRHVELDPAGSSQQLSALLLVGPAMGGVEIHLTGPLPSSPYVDLTIQVMEAFGAHVDRRDHATYVVADKPYVARDFTVEADHSSASYPLAAGWLTNRQVEIPNLDQNSLQPDRVFADHLARLDSPGPLEFDLEESPDIAPTLAVCALFRKAPTVLSGLRHLAIKESNRLEVLATELQKLGADIAVRSDGWEIRPASLVGPARLDPASDHRMAMCFGLVGLVVPGVEVSDPGCVSKSYPNFWRMLDGFRSREK